MKTKMNSFLFVTFLFLICSCGPDKLNPNLVTNKLKHYTVKTNSLSYPRGVCSYTSAGPPICGEDGKDYLNKDHAACFDIAVSRIGHCTCSKTLIVCGRNDDNNLSNYQECLAQGLNVEIIKYVPCEAKEFH
jgi:hypothetical protein